MKWMFFCTEGTNSAAIAILFGSFSMIYVKKIIIFKTFHSSLTDT